MDIKLVAVLALACSGNKTTPKAVHDDARAGSAHVAIDAAVPIDPNAKGDVQVRVEWKDVPADARGAPGRTACGTARPAAVVPTVLWGIPDVFVAIDAPTPTTSSTPSTSTSTSTSTIMLTDCVLAPRALVAHGTLAIASGMQAPAKLTVQRPGQLPLGGAVKEDKPREVYLPIAGHEVEVELDAGAIYRVAAGDEVAWIVATDHPFVGVTEASGNLVMRNVPAGPHAVTAWLPPRSGQPARVAKGTVNVAAGGLTDVTLDITKP